MKKELNVCLLNDSFPPAIDGVANTVVNYANIIQNGLGKSLVATPEYPNVKDNYSFDVFRYPSFDTTKLVGYRCGVPFDSNTIEDIASKNVDIIHSHCPVASTFLGRMLRDRIEKPLVFTYHTKFDIDIRKATSSKLLQKVAIDSLVANVEACDEVWVVSRGAGENLRSLGYSKDYIVMPNGVDFDKGTSTKEEIEAVKNEFNLHVNAPVYLFVGRMMWYKGIKIILDALKEKKNYGQDFRMLFVGEGADYKEIQSYTKELDLENKCIFAGAIRDRKKLKAIFSSCDIFLFPSTFDTNGIVVREAAAAGLGTILIKGSCAAEDTIDGQNVIQIEETAESLAKVLIDVDNNLDYFHRIGINAQNELYCSWQHSVEHAYDRYVEIVDNYQFDRNKLIRQDTTEALFAGFADLSKGIQDVRLQRQLLTSLAMDSRNKVEKLVGDTLDEINYIRDISKIRREEIRQYNDDEIDRYL